MKPHNFSCMLAVLVSFVSTGFFAAASAAEAERAQGKIQSLDVLQLEQERLRKLLADKPAAYVDNVMSVDEILIDLSDDSVPPTAESAGVSSYLVESRAGFAHSSNGNEQSASAGQVGLRTEYQQETLNYGLFVLQADFRQSFGDDYLNVIGPLGSANSEQSGRFSLRNYGLPLNVTTFADTSLGDIYSETTDVLDRQYKFSLGSSTLRGASTRIYSRDFDLRAGTGLRGRLQGGPYPGFERTRGEMSWLGFSHKLPHDLQAGVQITHTTGAQNYFGLGLGTLRPEQLNAEVTNVASALKYGDNLFADGDKRARITLIQSRYASKAVTELDAVSAQGVFADAGWVTGRWRHELGAYTADPGLNYADYVLAADTQGAYWRSNYSGMRLNFGYGMDYDKQNPSEDSMRRSGTRISGTGNVRYTLSRREAFGGSFNVWQTDFKTPVLNGVVEDGTRSVYANAYYQKQFYDWGSSRFLVNVYRNDQIVTNAPSATGEEVQWEHDWITGKYETMRPELTTTLGYAWDRSGGQSSTYPTFGVSGRYWLDANWWLGGNVRYTSRQGNLYTSQGLSGTVYTEWAMDAHWVLGAMMYVNQSSVDINSNPFYEPLYYRNHDTSGYVYLRWSASRGQGLHALGLRGPNSVGGGRISGTVFFDQNQDGVQQMNEDGVANVEVWLDERYRVVTDRRGRFEFPMAATGEHQLTLRAETLPLPWGEGDKTRQRVEVPLRGSVEVLIPVVKLAY